MLFRNVCLLVVLFLHESLTLNAQTPEGTVQYERMIRYSFENIKEAHGDDQRRMDWLASLPEEGTSVQVLSFNSRNALFTEGVSEVMAENPMLQRAIIYEGMLSGPTPRVRSVFYDFEKNRKLEQIMFLTRYFLVESEMEPLPWKLSGERKKILDYVCMKAELSLEDEDIVAWFTPEIPVSLGPSVYGGLPGLILAIERNRETIYMATSVDLTPPQEETLKKPDQGSEVSPEEFAAIRQEKEKEWEENPPGRGNRRYHR